jgi:hypothetical protein
MELRLALAAAGGDIPDAGPYLAVLGEELRELGNVDVSPLPDTGPNGAKGAVALAGLAARLPAAGVTALFRFLRAWVIRTGRTVEVNIGGDVIRITGARARSGASRPSR